jgi:UDP-GlcNAc3NAcA epimerase
MEKIAIVVGARPQFIKLAPLIEVLLGKVRLIVVHTGQHYDFEMSDLFFKQLDLPSPDYHLGVGSANQAIQTGRMMVKLEEVLLKESPDLVTVIGDTNSTIAGAVTAAKDAIALAHIEAGLRSKNQKLPEQINRIVTDRLSDILCCPNQSSVDNLKSENITRGVFLTGDILYDLVARISPSVEQTSAILRKNELKEGEFVFFTVHRAENVDNPGFLKSLVLDLQGFPVNVFMPLHPRTEKSLKRFGLYNKIKANPVVLLSKPIGIIESLALTKSSLGVITDSGGLQREAAFFGKKAYILRDETEWLELEKCGVVQCIGRDLKDVEFNWNEYSSPGDDYFQKASKNIAESILNYQL